MKQIANFYFWFWIIYFPTCIAYNDLPGMSSVDELMTFVLIGYTFSKRGIHYRNITNPEPWKEYVQFLWILAFYVAYSLIRAENVAGGVYLDFIQTIRPYSVIYCTWILNPQFNEKQKKWMVRVMVATLFSWVFYHPETTASLSGGRQAEFPVLGQLAICCGMAYYLFNDENKYTRRRALMLVAVGLLAPKFKFLGECVCFYAVITYLDHRLDFKSPKTLGALILLIAVVLTVTWTRFDVYYVSGMVSDERMARPETYKTAWKILWELEYFPFGPGMATLGTNGAWKYYSPLYYKYDLNTVWGLDEGGGFICDAFYPTLAQFGWVGVILFYIFWKRRLIEFNKIKDLKHYRVFLMAFFCLAIEQTSDSSFLSGKGMGYCMLIGLCLNANRNIQSEEDEDEDEDTREKKRQRRLRIPWRPLKQRKASLRKRERER